jgi:hypothetical protein
MLYALTQTELSMIGTWLAATAISQTRVRRCDGADEVLVLVTG